MKRNLLLLPCILVLAVACKPTEEKKSATALAPSVPAVNDTKAGSDNSAQPLADYTYSQKNDFISRLIVKMADMNRSLEVVAANIEKTSGAAKADQMARIGKLRDRSELLSKQINELSAATPISWTNLRTEAYRSYTSLVEEIESSRQWPSS